MELLSSNKKEVKEMSKYEENLGPRDALTPEKKDC